MLLAPRWHRMPLPGPPAVGIQNKQKKLANDMHHVCMSSIPRRARKHHTLTSFDAAGTTMASDASARTSCSWNSKQTEETCKHHHIFAKTHPRLMTFPPHSHRWGDGGTSPTHRPPAGRLPTATGTTATGCLLQREKHRLLPSTMKCQ